MDKSEINIVYDIGDIGITTYKSRCRSKYKSEMAKSEINRTYNIGR